MTDDSTIRADEQHLVDGLELLRNTPGQIEPDPLPGRLTVAHADYLAGQAVNVELAESLGVRSLMTHEDNPTEDIWPNFANHPAILFPWTSPDGRVEYQVRPDNPTNDQRGRPRKYMFRKDSIPVLWAVRPVAGSERIVIVEGTKQCLAAASYAPPGVAVYGMAGCRMWQLDGTPIADLGVADGREVVVILDADAAANADVYAAGTGLAEALAMEGATKVTFGRLPATGKAGLDDVLAGRVVERRADYLARIIETAKPKPADKAPRPKHKGQDKPDAGDRVTIVCNRDRLGVINDLTQALIDRWDGRELFNHGGVISRLKRSTMVPVDRGSARDLIQETALTVDENEGAQGTTYSFTWPDANSIGAAMSRAEKYSALERVSPSPFVRPDGTIVTEPGYDEATRTVLVSDPELAGLEVPEDPSAQEIDAARELLMTEWLGDFPFDSDADRANALALLVTPAIRGLVPRAPLAVVDGLQMGVGKNLLADCLITVYTGEPASPMNFVDEREELRKQITSAFRTGAAFFVFDEAHTIEGAALAQALTASTWQDRILGVSTMAEFPNRVTWLSLGNQVQVRGDLTRRVYRIALRPRYSNPQDRRAETFRHPGTSGLDLGSWTRKHRRELLTAILTLVRAWFAQGCPHPSRGVSFGSFEAWERTVGGIVEVAGLPSFLGNLTVWRSESDFDTQYWTNHLRWLLETFGSCPFRTADVRSKALTDPAGYLAPPKLDDPADKSYGKALGEAYSRLRGRRYGTMTLDRLGSAHGNVSQWRVLGGQDDQPPAAAPDPEPEPIPGPVAPELVCPRGCRGVCVRPGSECLRLPVDSEESTSEPGPAPYNEHGEARGADESDLTGGETDACSQSVDNAVDNWAAEHPDAMIREVKRASSSNPERGWSSQCRRAGCSEHWRTGLDSEAQARQAYEKHQCGIELTTEFPITEENRPALELLAGGSLEGELVTLDLETGDAANLYRADPDTYIRLAGWAVGDGEVQVTDERPASAARLAIGQAAVITGHNIMAFDLPALVRAGQLTMADVHRGAKTGLFLDGLLAARHLDPPMARDKGVDAERKYDLGSLANKYGLSEKLSDISKALARKHGGWDHIPVDADSEDGQAFRRYLTGDVTASRELFHIQVSALGRTMPEYLLREHRVAAIASQISVNGFRVDVPELERRVAELEARKADAMGMLSERYDIPTKDAKGKAYLSPLSTKAGKLALTNALRAAGATSIWVTEKTQEIQVSADHMRHLAQEYHHLPAVREIAKAVFRIVSARTVYETVHKHLGPDGRVHPRVSFKQATGRWSLTEPGLTVMGKRGGRHVERMVFLPDPGEVIIAADLSQVDMRAVAGLSQDAAYIEMLRHEDPHTEIAKALFGDAARREQAKAIGHGWNYSRGIKAIAMAEEIDPALVARFDRSMRERFPRLVQWQEEMRELASSGALLDNGFGRPMRPDPLRAYTQGPALMGQGAARDLMMTGLLNLADRYPETLPMLRAQVHDEIVLSVPAELVTDVSRAVVECMTFEWRGVPILADASKPGQSWGHVYEKG